MKKHRVFSLFTVIFVAFLLFQSVTIVPTGYTGVKTSFGQIQEATIQSGKLNFTIPFVQSIHTVSNKQQDKHIEAQIWGEASDKTPVYAADVIVTYQVLPEKSAWLYANVSDTKNLVGDELVASAIKSAMAELGPNEVTNRTKIEPLAQQMTNMLMNGAVAIYGGVGVMEIHQPLPQAVESVAQAVEDLAVNAHISLRELKNCVDKVLEKKIPGYKQLMETNPVVAARATVNGATITAYTNGYAVYEADDAHTVLDVNRCGDYRYDFNDGTYEVVPAEVFEDAEWTVRLVMEGERRLENNRSKISRDYEEFALSCDGTDWCDAAMVDFMEAENAEMLADEELRKLYAAMRKLTERQQEVVQLYFYKGLNQYEIADELGIARRSVGDCLEGALKKIRKNF